MALKHLGKIDWQKLQYQYNMLLGQYRISLPLAIKERAEKEGIIRVRKRRREQRRKREEEERKDIEECKDLEEGKEIEEKRIEEKSKEKEEKKKKKKKYVTFIYGWLDPLKRSADKTPCDIKDKFIIENMKEKVLSGIQTRPVLDLNKTQVFLYKSNLYAFLSSDIHSIEERELLIAEHFLKKETKFAKIKQEIELFEKLQKVDLSVARREFIPESVRFIVWRRDEGKCRRCGSNENLELDHIVPVSKGGSSTYRNIQLLCERCNRQKSAKV